MKGGLFVAFDLESKRFLKGFSLVVGLMDAATGIGLVFLPVLTLQLMGLDAGAYATSLIRFIGTFVFASGGLYLWGLILGKRTSSREPLYFAWVATSWIRLCVGTSTGIMIAIGELSPGWLSVPMADLSIAIFQLYLIWTGAFSLQQK